LCHCFGNDTIFSIKAIVHYIFAVKSNENHVEELCGSAPGFCVSVEHDASGVFSKTYSAYVSEIAPCCREVTTKNKNLGCGLQVQPTLDYTVPNSFEVTIANSEGTSIQGALE
jgi:hypothetical protein